MLKRAAILLPLVLLVLVPSGLASNFTQSASQSWDFAPGGKVELHLMAGDLRIVSTSEPQISIQYTMRSNDADFAGKVRPEFDVRGSNAVMRLGAPRNGSIDVELRVPRRCDVYLRVFAGDISVGQIEGNLNVETHAGDIKILLSDVLSYSMVDASTRAGDVSAPFGKAHGRIGNSLKYEGQGQYRAHAHTLAGDISFEQPTSARLDEPSKCEK